MPALRRHPAALATAGAAALASAGVLAFVIVQLAGADRTDAATRLASEAVPVVAAISPAAGSVVGGDTLTISGSALEDVTTVTIGGKKATVVSASATAVTVTTPPAASFATAAATVAVSDGGGTAVASGEAYDYQIVKPVDAELAYVFTYWKHYNLASYGFFDDQDCANFASQALLARGWTMDDDWWASGTGDDFAYSTAWVSSTALMDYLSEHPDRATELTDAQRDQVKVGDIVQFDWDNSGDRDHTGIVTKVVHTADGTKIYYAGHTDDTDYRSVDYAITTLHPGGAVYYWSLN